MQTSIIGSLGSGKNVLATYYALLSYKLNPNRLIYSNYKLKLPNYRKLEPYHFSKPTLLPYGIMIIIDEIYSLFDAREFMSKKNIAGSNFIAHTRKNSMDIFGLMPLFSMQEKRMRGLSQLIITAETRLNELSDDFNYEFYYVDYDITNYMTISFQDAYNYIFPYFNTREKQENIGSSKTAFNIIRENPESLLENVIEIYNDIEPLLEGNRTKDNIEFCLLQKGYYEGWKKYVYLYSKQLQVKENDDN